MKYILVATYDCGCIYESGWAGTEVRFFEELGYLKAWLQDCSLMFFCYHTYPCNIKVYTTDGKEIEIEPKYPLKYTYMCWNDKCEEYGEHKLSDKEIKKCPKCKKKLEYVRRLNG